MKHKSQSGFAHFALVAVVVILVAVGGVSYYVYHKNHDQKKAVGNNSQSTQKTATVTTYEECNKTAGSKIQETFPQVCVTKGGQTFTQSATQKYLTIKEWGVRMKLSTEVEDAAYTYSKAGTTEAWDEASDIKLYKSSLGANCMTGIIFQYKPTSEVQYATSKTTAQQAYENPSLNLGVKKIGAYYYGSEKFVGNCDAPQNVQDKGQVSVQAFLDAYDSLDAVPVN